MSARALVAITLCALLALAASSSHAQAPAPEAQAPDQRDVADEARAHFQRGVELYRTGDLRATIAEFERARELRDSPLLSFYIGRVAFELRELARSYGAYERCLAAPADQISPEQRAEAEAKLAELRSQVAFVTITTNVPGARIRIDDEPQGEAPLAGHVVLDVGTHRVRASKAGYAASAQAVTVGGGDERNVQLELEPLEAPPRVALPQPQPSPATEAAVPARAEKGAHDFMTPLAWSGLGVSIGLAALGTVTGAMALRTSSDLDDTRFTGASARSDFDDHADRVRRLAITTDVFFGAALATAAATLGFTIHRARHPNQSERRVSLGARLTPLGVSVQGRFAAGR